MRTFGQKPTATQRTTPVKPTTFDQAPLEHSINHLQRTIGNQAVQRLLRANAGNTVIQRQEVTWQREGKPDMTVDVEKDAMGGYGAWDMSGERWHINTKLGGTKKGKQVYHVTKEGIPKLHYFFTLDGGVIKDSSPGGKVQRGSLKFSALPQLVQDFVRDNIAE